MDCIDMSKRKFIEGDTIRIKDGKFSGKFATIYSHVTYRNRLKYVIVDNNGRHIGSTWYAYQLQKVDFERLIKTYTYKFLTYEYTVTVTPYISGLLNVYWPMY